MKTDAILLWLLLGVATQVHGQGSVVFQNTGGVGKEKYVYAVNPADPTSSVLNGQRSKAEGSGFFAELWWAPGADASWDALEPVPGSRVTFRTGTTAGLIHGIAKLLIPGTHGGDMVTLQLRAWWNAGGTLGTWAEMLCADGYVQHGGSPLIKGYELAGVDADNVPHLGSLNLANVGLQSFGLYVLPEPSSVALGALGLGMILLRRRKTRRIGL